jgi:hypothetical protein
MTPLSNKDPHILIGMADESDCRLIGSWLLKVAEAQGFWSQMQDCPPFENSEAALCWWDYPSLECAALEALSALKQTNWWLLDSGETSHDLAFYGFEFAVMIQLGFFVLADQTYQMTVPESVTFEQVQRAALEVAATKAYRVIVQPERMLRTLL